MDFFAQLWEIVNGQLNKLLDRPESPEAIFTLLLRRMEMSLADARCCAVTAIAGERRIGHDLAQNRALVEQWHRRAQEAVAAGRDDLARRALLRKRNLDTLSANLAEQHAAALQNSQQAYAALESLETRFRTVHCAQRTLVAQQEAVLVRLALLQTTDSSLSGAETPGVRFAQLERQFLDLVREWTAQVQLDEVLGGLHGDATAPIMQQAVERELAALKAREEIGRPAP